MFRKVPKNVLILGIVSFFNDIASEMIYPIVPIFLTSVLNAPVSLVGLIEGIAESTASISKFLFGYLSDKVKKRKVFVTWGYSFSAISKLLIAFASSWYFVLFARFIDRLGKGLRTSARDSLLLQSSTDKNRGFIFGFHRSLDSAGAVLGPIIAFLLLYFLKEDIRLIFLLAFFPSVIGVLLLIFLVKEKKKKIIESEQEEEKKKIRLNFKHLDRRFMFFFLVSIIFSLGNSSDAFLILRSKNLGLSTTLTIFVYVLYNLFQTVFAAPAGRLADSVGSKKVYATGLLIFSFVYFLFGVTTNSLLLWVIFPIYGIYIAFTDGVSKAYISEFIKEEKSGTYFGLYQMGIAIAAFIASLVGGILWTNINPSATFFYGSFMAFMAFLIFVTNPVKRL